MDVRFPFQEVVENLTGSSAKARDWLMGHLSFQPSLSWSQDLQDAVLKTGKDAGQGLAQVIEIQKTIIKTAKAEIKGADKAKELFGGDLQSALWDTKPTEESVAALRAEASKTMADIIRSSSTRITTSDVERARNTAVAAVEEFGSIAEPFERLYRASSRH